MRGLYHGAPGQAGPGSRLCPEPPSVSHQARPAGVSLHLLGAELVARNLSSFSSADPSLAKELKIPDFERSNRMTYPPHRPPDWLNVMPVAYHPGADWAAHQSERAQAIRREHEHTIAYYENMAKERAEREERERAMSGAHVDVIGAMVCKPAGTP
jgi:hypothetical protein